MKRFIGILRLPSHTPSRSLLYVDLRMDSHDVQYVCSRHTTPRLQSTGRMMRVVHPHNVHATSSTSTDITSHRRMVVFTPLVQASPQTRSHQAAGGTQTSCLLQKSQMMKSLTLIHPLPADEINVTNQP